MAILAINTPIDIAKTYDNAKNITGISKAATGVVTSAAHGYANGDIVVLAVSGMAELDGQPCRVANVAANTYELEGIDTSSFGSFTAGTVQRVSAWDRLGNAQSISASQAQANRIEITTLTDTMKQYMFGLQDSPEITASGLFDPNNVAVKNIRTASRGNLPRAVLVTFSNGTKMLFNSYCSGGDGFSAQNGQALTQDYKFTQIRNAMWY